MKEERIFIQIKKSIRYIPYSNGAHKRTIMDEGLLYQNRPVQCAPSQPSLYALESENTKKNSSLNFNFNETHKSENLNFFFIILTEIMLK